jgi:hypothetical protein
MACVDRANALNLDDIGADAVDHVKTANWLLTTGYRPE